MGSNMYNLFVAYDVEKWNRSYFTYPIDRVFEHTSSSLLQRYKSLSKNAIKELSSFPCVFAYENVHQLGARVGWINNISVSPVSVEIEFEFDVSFPQIPYELLNTIRSKLDINGYELSRTHWSVKSSNLLNVLSEEGLISKSTLKEFSVFICYASEDSSKAEALHEYLIGYGLKAWFNKRNILPGKNWEDEIHSAIRNSHTVIALLSKSSITKEGFVQKELRTALDVANEKPEGTIFVIPARLEDCQIPSSLAKYQWVDLFSENGLENMMQSLQERARSLGIRIRKTT